VEALRLAAPEKDYLPVRGLATLREAVAEFHRKHDNLEVHPDGVIVGPGSKELMFLLQLTFYGEIVVISPCWVSYLPQARIIGRRVGNIQTSFENGWKITAEQLEQEFAEAQDDYRPRLIVLNYPANPTGMTFAAGELKEIAAVARKFGAIVLSDEIYGQLHHTGQHASIAQFYPEGTIVSSGLSKWCGAGGWRLGTFSFPAELYWLLDAMAAVASETYTSVSAPIQHAAVQAFHGGVDIERYLWHARRILSALGGRCVDLLRSAGVRVHAPDGAFYLYPDFTEHRESLTARGIHNSRELCRRLIEETGVAILPGVSFAQPHDALTARIACVDFDGARALAASENIPLHEPLPEDFIDNWCERVVQGVERLAEWVGGR
jgi:aspartate aminotransferase